MIGKVFKTKQGSFLTIKEDTGEVRSNRARVYVLECNVCSVKDKELWYYGSITSDKYSLGRGQSPCGCSKPSYNCKQWKIRLLRVCKEKGYQILCCGPLDGKSSIVKLFNPVTGNVWETTLHYLINQGKGDPWVYNIGRSDRYHIEDFKNAGLKDSIYSFVRSERRNSQGKRGLWEVYCKLCNKSYTRYQGDLKAGKIPCDCRKRGYDVNAEFGYFYILKVRLGGDWILKFGITSRAPSKRWKCFISNNKLSVGDVKVLLIIRNVDKISVRDFETFIKREINSINKYPSKEELPDGYTEAIRYTEEVLDCIKEHLLKYLPCPAVNHGGRHIEGILPMLEALPDNVIVYLNE